MIIVGSSVVAGKIMVDGLPVFLSSGLRFLLASVAILPILFYREGGFPELTKASWMILALQALCGSFLFTVLLLYGLKDISPASAGIVTSTTPMFMGIIGWVFFKEKCSVSALTGIILSFAGIIIIGSGQHTGDRQNSFLGLMLVLGAVAAESLFLVLRKWIKEPISPLAATAIICLLGLLWFLPSAIYEAFSVNFSRVTPQTWGAVIYYGLVVTVMAYLFWFAGVVHVPASSAGIITGILPVSAVFLSALVLGEDLHWYHLAGCVLVLSGILSISGILSRFSPKKDIRPKKEQI